MLCTLRDRGNKEKGGQNTKVETGLYVCSQTDEPRTILKRRSDLDIYRVGGQCVVLSLIHNYYIKYYPYIGTNLQFR